MVDLPSYPEDAARRETVVESRSYASWGRRVGAYLIDTLIILAPLAIAIGFLVAVEGDDDDSAWAAVGIVYLVTLVLPFVYYTVFHGRVVLPVILVYLWPLWDAKNQALHDKVVGSVVKA
ncbi:MAG TPA: RDD family protein [Gaiellaceae bacterium]|nr:RDD family protein [Gaiellaceae bacterium]